MSTFSRFEDIDAWKQARELNALIYELTSGDIYNNDKRLISQINGSAGSIMDNIAEGQGRGGNKEFIQFLWISKASSAELRSQLYRSLDHRFIDQNTFDKLYEMANTIEKMIKGLINHLQKTEHRGSKYKN